MAGCVACREGLRMARRAAGFDDDWFATPGNWQQRNPDGFR
jgi:hypothetical protein